MKTGKIIALVALTSGVGVAGYYGYKQYAKKAASDSAGSDTQLVPAGTNPATGVQQYVNSAGDIVDSANNLITSGKNVLSNLLPSASMTAADALAKYGIQNGQYVRNANNLKVYKIENNTKRYVPNMAVYNKYQVTYKEIKDNDFFASVPDGTELSGLRGLSGAQAYRLLN